jgi:hypothetical protein
VVGARLGSTSIEGTLVGGESSTEASRRKPTAPTARATATEIATVRPITAATIRLPMQTEMRNA